MTTARPEAAPRLRIVHLFPDLLNVYGDAGNVRTVVVRAERRGIAVDLMSVRAGDRKIPSADLFLIGGGEDREQMAVAEELRRLAAEIRAQISDGAAVLAVCAGYQMLGRSYLTGEGVSIPGVAILPVETVAGRERLVGPVVGTLCGWPTSPRHTVIGFENHSGRTVIDPGSEPLAIVEIGYGNNGEDGSEGMVAPPGAGGVGGLRIGTYLHGPLLPRNPHVADALIAAALARGGSQPDLEPLDDAEEWRAHERYLRRTRETRRRRDRLPSRLRRLVDPARGLIGF
jgi:CobQ-like glutamine amidotransferase family enzyme